MERRRAMAADEVSAVGEVVIQAAGLEKHYGRRRRRVEAVRNVSFEVNRGEIFGLIGPDGAGKTSIIQMLAAVLEPDRGAASVGGINVVSDSDRVKAFVGYMPQGLGLNLYDSLSVEENIEFFRDLRKLPEGIYRRNVRDLLDMTRLTPFLDRRARNLSGGMRQKLGLICTLIHLPDVLLLDEPTTGVDPISRRDFWQIIHRLIEERQVSVLLTTSYMDEAERCHRVALLNQGQIIAHGRPDSLKAEVKGESVRLVAEPQREALVFLGKCPGVQSAEFFGREIRVSMTAEPEEICSYLSNRGIKVNSLVRCEAGLEDLFVQALPAESDKISAAFSMAKPVTSSEEIAARTKSLTRRFGSFTALQDVDLVVKTGEIFGLLGPNGAGKTTLMRILCGLLEPSAGSAEVGGFDVARERSQVWSHIGYMSQRFSLYRDLTVIENLRLYAGLYSVRGKDFGRIIESLGLSGFERRLTSALPLGLRQRVSLACAMLHEPPVLFLDEPTSGVDPAARRTFWEIIYSLSRKSRVTIFISTHYADEAEHCDRLGFMSEGELIAIGAPGDLRSASEKRAGQLLAVTTPQFRAAFELIAGVFPGVTLYGSSIHVRSHDPDADRLRILSLLENSGSTGVQISSQPLPMEAVFIDYIEAAEVAYA